MRPWIFSRPMWGGLVLAALVLTLGTPKATEAQYLGLEPERLTSLLRIPEDARDAGYRESRLEAIEGLLSDSGDPSALWEEKAYLLAAAGRWEEAEAALRRVPLERARLPLAVAMAQQGKNEEALALLREGMAGSDPRFVYAGVLLRLRAEKDLDFSDLRKDLRRALSLGAPDPEIFELWLALNPKEDELKELVEKGTPGTDAVVRWHRAEAFLRLDEPQKALGELKDIAAESPSLSARIERVRAMAYFVLKSDAAGQSIYERLLGRLDERTAELLFRDISAISTAGERAEFRDTPLDGQADLFRRFWMGRHPVPAEQVNPRLGEHYRRLARALREHGLESTGGGYFTDRETFLSISPALPYYDSEVLFDEGAAARFWIDHRGLVLLRHGEPDSRIPPRTFGDSQRTESWVVVRFQTQPLLFNFVHLPQVSEWTLVMNLGVAATRPVQPDDPERVLDSLTRSYIPLYQSRVRFHPVYTQVLQTRSRTDLERALKRESEQMSSFLKAALVADSTSYYTRDNTLPMAVAVSDFYSEGQPAIQVDFAVDLRELDEKKLQDGAKLETRLLLYDRNWKEVKVERTRDFPLERPFSEEGKVYLGSVQVFDLDPEEYRVALHVYQRDTGRIAIARGRHAVTYVHHAHLGLSDLFPQQQFRTKAAEKAPKKSEARAESPWLPVPGRVIQRDSPSRIGIELYNLKPDPSGVVRYEVEEKVLTLYEDPGFWDRMAGFGSLAGQLFFPVYTFAAQAGASVLGQATADEDDGIVVLKRRVESPAAPTVREEVQLELKDLKKGIYTVYVTVRDLVSGELSSRFLTVRVG